MLWNRECYIYLIYVLMPTFSLRMRYITERKQFRKIPSFIQSLKYHPGTYITVDHWSLYFSILWYTQDTNLRIKYFELNLTYKEHIADTYRYPKSSVSKCCFVSTLLSGSNPIWSTLYLHAYPGNIWFGKYRITYNLLWKAMFWSRVGWFANTFHEWRRHEWK